MKQRLASPSDVIDLGRIKELVGIEVSADALTIKAATTYFDIMQSADVKKAIPAIVHLTSVLGDPQVRHRGTIGGSIANNDPAANYPAAVLALGATIKTDKRSIAADDFFKGLFATALEDGEIITQVVFPIRPRRAMRKCVISPRVLRHRRVRGQDQDGGCSRRRNRRFAERCHAGAGDRGGAEGQLGGGRTRQRNYFRRRAVDRFHGSSTTIAPIHQGDGTARRHSNRSGSRLITVLGSTEKQRAR